MKFGMCLFIPDFKLYLVVLPVSHQRALEARILVLPGALSN